MANYAIPNVVVLDESVNLTKTSVTCSGASAQLVAADPDRKVLIVAAAAANAATAFDPTGGTCALDSGIILNAGDTVLIKGLPAQSAMTQFGTSGNKFTLFVGKH